MSVWAIVAAAGTGDRLGADRPKAFVRLGEQPLLGHSIERLDRSDWIEGIVVVAPPGWEEPAILLAEELGASKASTCVTGGATRAQSVRLGLAEVPAEAAVVLVHDAARPLLPAAVIARVLAPPSAGWDGAVPGLPVADTVKRVDGDRIVATVLREQLAAVQTPQAFVAAVLREAVEAGGEAGDCAALVEARGGRVTVVPGDRRLLKVTTAEDLELVSAWLGSSSA